MIGVYDYVSLQFDPASRGASTVTDDEGNLIVSELDIFKREVEYISDDDMTF